MTLSKEVLTIVCRSVLAFKEEDNGQKHVMAF